VALHFEAALQYVGAARMLPTVAVADAVGSMSAFISISVKGDRETNTKKIEPLIKERPYGFSRVLEREQRQISACPRTGN
jgi:hypothetical protein